METRDETNPTENSERKPFTTFLTIKNNSKSSFTTKVRWIDNFDWEGGNRPDYNFNNLTVSPLKQITKREDINTNASRNMFTLDLSIAGGLITLRCDQRIAKGINEDYSAYEVPDDIRYIKNIPTSQGALYTAVLDSNPGSTYFKDKSKINIEANTTSNIIPSVQVLGNTVIIIIANK